MKKILFTFLVAICILKTDNCYAQWQPDVRLTNHSANSYTSENNAWCIASSGDFVHAAWFDNRDGNYQIYYKRSTDGGVTWGTDTRLTNTTNVSWYPSVSVSGQVVHIVWADLRNGLPNYEIYYKRSTDGGANWGTDIRLTNNSAVSANPSVSIIGQVLHVVWEDYRDSPNGEIYHKRSTDGGMSWEADTRLTNNGAYSVLTSVAVSGQFVHVVWQDFRDGNAEIYYKRSSDGGVIWGADTRLTNNTLESSHPSISISGQVLHIVWMELHTGNNKEIYYKRSTDGGSSWGTDTRLTNDPAESWSPSISVSGQVLHVVWEDNRDGNSEIYYKNSSDGGVSWGADTRLTNSLFGGWYPSVSVSGQVVHVVWQDERDGNWEIYYKRNPTGNVVGIEQVSPEITRILSWNRIIRIHSTQRQI